MSPNAPMILAAVPEERLVAFSVLAVVSIAYLLLAFLTVWRTRSLELKLIVLGLLTGVLAVWCGTLPVGEAVSFSGRTGQPGEAVWAVAGTRGAETPGRIAVLLILGGLAVGLWSRWGSPAAPVTREEVSRDRPV